jgi:4-carboxymuconolactone decarboxylase
MAARKRTSRLPPILEEDLTDPQRALLRAIRRGPRGRVPLTGPFAVYLRAPEFGDLAQRLGEHCRFRTAVTPRLSEFAILVIARLWRAEFEWHSHVGHAAEAGVSPTTIADLAAGRAPNEASSDEQAVYEFIMELHETRGVGDRSYRRVRALLGDTGTVELVGILGYYTMVAMLLDAFEVPPPVGAKPVFRSPVGASARTRTDTPLAPR